MRWRLSLPAGVLKGRGAISLSGPPGGPVPPNSRES